MRLRGCLYGCMLAAGGAVTALLAGEALLRMVLPQPVLIDPDAFLPDPVLGVRLMPGFEATVATTEYRSTWVINEDGHRGPRAGERGPAAMRIVALGDSFTFGYGVEEEEAWPRRLEALVNAGTRDAVEVVNLGVGGYGTREEVRYLEREMGRLTPDLVLVAFYVGNDPLDNLRWSPDAARGEGPTDPTRGEPDRIEMWKRWFGARSHLYSFVSIRADELLVTLGVRRLVYPFEVDILRTPPPAGVNAAWRATRGALEELARVTAEASIPVRVLIVPMKHQVDDGFWVRLTARYERLAGARAVRALDRERPQRILEDMLLDLGLEWFDLLEGLRREARRDAIVPTPLYWPRDQHWTPEGHATAARLIADRLALEGLIEP